MDIPGASSAAGEESSGVVLGHQRTSSQELSPDTPLVGTQPAARVAPVAVQQDQDQEVQEESAPGGKTRFMTADEKRRAMHLLFQGVSARKVAKILGRGHCTNNGGLLCMGEQRAKNCDAATTIR